MIRLDPRFSRDYLLHHGGCPLRELPDGHLEVGIVTDHAPAALYDFAFAYGMSVKTRVLTQADLEGFIERAVTQSSQTGTEVAGFDRGAADARILAHEAPVVRYVNLIVSDAHKARASDIHLESEPSGLSVRYRVDGVLGAALPPPPGTERAVTSRLKLLADLDTTETRKPQDGRIRFRLGDGELDVRISAVPTLHGESVVLRLLDHGFRPAHLEELGLPAPLEGPLRRLASLQHGLVLVTGPTGSGKTTTLYAMLKQRDASAEKIVTVEDPVEYQLSGVTQVPIRAEGGVGFASALRSLLRQDPDVIMIGEMRDPETAETAVQAALTGHLVLSTLHTIDARTAVIRLLELGVPAFLVAATLRGVLAQRLARRLCQACQGPLSVDCPECQGSGFRGRIGLYELLVLDEDVRYTLANGDFHRRDRTEGLVAGMRMGDDGARKAALGLTTLEEVARVTR